MDVHKNARTTPYSRALIAQRIRLGERVGAVSRAFGICDRTAAKWARRAAEGVEALQDRSCRPHRSPRAYGPAVMVEIARLRALAWTGLQIADAIGLSQATVARSLRQLGLARLPALTPPRPARRYEWARPGQLVHVDTKRLGRFATAGHRIHGDPRTRQRGIGWEFVHVCVDDHSRVAYAEVLPGERREHVAAFIRRAAAWFARRGVIVERVLTDNAKAFDSQLFAAACRALEAEHRHTRPYTPRTNGKAERFIQTLLREWAYGVSYASSTHRSGALGRWLHYYNAHRRHSALGGQPPITRLVRSDDLLTVYS
jgi:transposase InsO family protein